MTLSPLIAHRFISSAVFSIALETLVVFLILRYVCRNANISAGRILQAGFFATFATIPYVWFVFPYAAAWPHTTAVIAAETFAVIVEAVFYRLYLRIGWGTALGVSFLANAASYLLGPALRAHGLWLYW